MKSATPVNTLHPRLFADANDFAALSVRLDRAELGHLARAHLLREAEELLEAPPLVCRKDECGKRILLISRAAIDRIAKLSMAARLTDDGRYAHRAIREALNVSAFPDWNPSHFLDTAEMTLAVAICYDWLYDHLTDAERETLYQAILRKGLVDETGDLRTGIWVDRTNNWCQVCHGGLVAGAIAIAERNPEITRKVIDRAVKNLPFSMSVFGPDGGFAEGPTDYWPYAMAFNALLLWAIEKFDGTDHGLSALPGFVAEVEYLDACTGPSRGTFNYSDSGSLSLDLRGVSFPQWWLARRFGRPDTLVFHEADALRRCLAPPSAGEPLVRFDRFFPFLLFCLEEPTAGTESVSPLARVIDGENPIAVMRTSWTDPDAWYAGLKGGRASCSHGHMDIGSFVLEADGVRWVRDLGSETYSRIEASPIGERLWDFRQGAPRWTIFRYATQGHGTLQFGDEEQDVDATARFSPLQADGKAMTTRLDLTAVYGRNVVRTFTLGTGGGFTVSDEIQSARPGETVTWRINTCADIRVDGNRATLSATDAAGRLRTLKVTAAPADIAFAVVDRSKAAHAYESDNPGVRQLFFTRVVPTSGQLTLSVSFTR